MKYKKQVPNPNLSKFEKEKAVVSRRILTHEVYQKVADTMRRTSNVCLSTELRAGIRKEKAEVLLLTVENLADHFAREDSQFSREDFYRASSWHHLVNIIGTEEKPDNEYTDRLKGLEDTGYRD